MKVQENFSNILKLILKRKSTFQDSTMQPNKFLKKIYSYNFPFFLILTINPFSIQINYQGKKSKMYNLVNLEEKK